ncbi:MAG: hypothetical protein AAGM67_11725 [Bacteroidota bacterium]
MHRWPFDVEEQLVFSSLVDNDLGVANVGRKGTPGQFDGGTRQILFPEVTPNQGQSGAGSNEVAPGSNRGHSAIITIYETCWFNSFSRSYAKDSGIINESGSINITDTHDFASVYGEFLATGNDPTIGQLGSIRFGGAAQAGGGIAGGSAISNFVNQAPQ